MEGRGSWSHTTARTRNYRRAVIQRSRVSNYLLNPSKSNGKAEFLRSLGYNMRNQAGLQEDLRKGLSENCARVSEPNRFGRVHFQVNMTIGIDRKEKVVTGWFMDKGDSAPRLSTLRPYHGKKDDYRCSLCSTGSSTR